jgi:hypothetical protein
MDLFSSLRMVVRYLKKEFADMIISLKNTHTRIWTFYMDVKTYERQKGAEDLCNKCPWVKWL